MGSKRPDRRGFLKGGAALAGGLTLGAVEPALGQTTASGGFIKGNEELVLYGERSRHVTSVRMAHPPGGRPSPDAYGNIFILRLRFRIRWARSRHPRSTLWGPPVAPSFRISIPGNIVS